jgi:hypothetical protein
MYFIILLFFYFDAIIMYTIAYINNYYEDTK